MFHGQLKLNLKLYFEFSNRGLAKPHSTHRSGHMLLTIGWAKPPPTADSKKDPTSRLGNPSCIYHYF